MEDTRAPARFDLKSTYCEQKIEVKSPFSEEIVGTVPRADVVQVEHAFTTAAGFRSRLSRHERREILLRTALAVEARRDVLARLMTAESGLCIKDTRHEVDRAYNVFRLASDLLYRDDSETFACDIGPNGQSRKVFTARYPLLGVIGAITPFNHPLNMVAHKVAPAIATGNRMVLKPSELTPLTALALADILYESGLPSPMFQVITGFPSDIGDAILTNPHAELITFTGSVHVGKLIASRTGYKRLVLELGGNDPLIVLDDADQKRAAELAVFGATGHSGQRCTAIKRVLILESTADEFASHALDQVRRLRWGDPENPLTDIGTVISVRAADTIRRRVEDAISRGATLLYGNEGRGALYSPTLLDYVPADCELVEEETFGPVIPIIRCRDMDHLVHLCNGTRFGLSAGVCTNRLDVVTKLVNELEVGSVNIWEAPGYRLEITPFGGVKDSGFGKEGIIESMKNFTTIKTYSLPWPTQYST